VSNDNRSLRQSGDGASTKRAAVLELAPIRPRVGISLVPVGETRYNWLGGSFVLASGTD